MRNTKALKKLNNQHPNQDLIESWVAAGVSGVMEAHIYSTDLCHLGYWTNQQPDLFITFWVNL